jgi:histone H3/H4
MSDSEESATGDTPSLLKMNQVQNVYHNVEVVDEDGSIITVKMQASNEFKAKFNKFVHQLVLDCVKNARANGRKMMTPEDVPELEEV